MDRHTMHTFHIPVLGLGYSIDTPVKVARFGISSVISIMDDELVEKMREYHSLQTGRAYWPIHKQEEDHRARRITAYLDLVHDIVEQQMSDLRKMPFGEDNDLVKYFELLPDVSIARQTYDVMQGEADGQVKSHMQEHLRRMIHPGSIDVNIMAKVDKLNTDEHGNALTAEFSDASAALRGFANSRLQSSIIFSAGYNPRLYNYIESFSDFFANSEGMLNKKIILKVSDYRSALVQGKILAKKGIWISEFRIESGLNCGGHAFATDGLLLGPILEEFKNKRQELADELLLICNAANKERGRNTFTQRPGVRITVQGGIGTAREDRFLMEHYMLDGTGWGSPFLLVPEATNVDEVTIQQLATAKKEDYYMSHASPLGIAFNNFRKSSAERQRVERIDNNRPGSPCYKKFLESNTEFTVAPICTASREYINHKVKELQGQQLTTAEYALSYARITEKDCLCEGLGAAALIKEGIPLSHKLGAVTICPGPNLAYFSGTFSLQQMVSHIYGRINLLNNVPRPNMFVNELELYVDYFKNKVAETFSLNAKQEKYLQTFKANLLSGIEYYKGMAEQLAEESDHYIAAMKEELELAAMQLAGLMPAKSVG